MRETFMLAMALLVLLSANVGRAQDVQVPLDSSGQVEILDASTAQRLQLFLDYPRFEEARLYQSGDSSFVLEISYRQDDKLLKERKPLSLAEATALRGDISRRMLAFMPAAGLNQEGRAKLLVGTTTLGLCYYGWAMPVIMQVEDDGKTIGAIYMLTSSASFLIPYLISRHTSVSDPAASAALYGGSRGIFHGFGLYGVAVGRKGTAEGMFASSVAFSVAEMICGFQLADRHHWSAGKVSTLGVCSDFGMVIGWSTGMLATESLSHTVQIGYDDDEVVEDAEERMRIVFAGFLAGAAGGMVVGDLLTDAQDYSKGDAYVLREVTLLGMGTTWAISDIANASSEGTELAFIAGPAFGLWLGHRLTRDVNFTPSQGTLMGLSELGGALFGLGVAYLVDAKESGAYLALGTLGAASGFGLAYRSFSRTAHAQPRHASWDVQVAPQGLMTYDRDGRQRVVPGANLTIQF